MALDIYDIKIGNSLESTGSITHSGSVVLTGSLSAQNINTTSLTANSLTLNSQTLYVSYFGIYLSSSLYQSNATRSLYLDTNYITDPTNLITTLGNRIYIEGEGVYNVILQCTLDFSAPVNDYGFISLQKNNILYQANNYIINTGSNTDAGKYVPVTLNTLIQTDPGTNILEFFAYSKNNSYRVKTTDITTFNSIPVSYIYIHRV